MRTVEVFAGTDAPSARRARTALSAAGIESSLREDQVRGMLPTYRIDVAEEDVSRASEVLGDAGIANAFIPEERSGCSHTIAVLLLVGVLALGGWGGVARVWLAPEG